MTATANAAADARGDSQASRDRGPTARRQASGDRHPSRIPSDGVVRFRKFFASGWLSFTHDGLCRIGPSRSTELPLGRSALRAAERARRPTPDRSRCFHCDCDGRSRRSRGLRRRNRARRPDRARTRRFAPSGASPVDGCGPGLSAPIPRCPDRSGGRLFQLTPPRSPRARLLGRVFGTAARRRIRRLAGVSS